MVTLMFCCCLLPALQKTKQHQQSYSIMTELRQKIIVQILARDTPTNIAHNFGTAHCTVYSAKRLYEATGSFTKCLSPGQPRSVQTGALIEAVKEQIKENPRKNIHQLAREHQVDKTTMNKLVKKDLKLKSEAVVKVQSLTTLQRQKCLKRCREMLNWQKSNLRKVIAFSDEKNFFTDAFSNDCNTHYLAKKPDDVDPSIRYEPKSKHPTKAIMLSIECSDGFKIPPIWIEGNLDSTQYCSIFKDKVLPVLENKYGPGNFLWQQDGAPSHTSKATQKFLEEKLGSKGFWSKELWPPSSPKPESPGLQHVDTCGEGGLCQQLPQC